MNATILVALIPAVAAVVGVALTYVFNKRREHEAEWRKLKLDHYKEYVAALSGIVGTRATDATHARYSDAFNALVLIAPPDVLQALYGFQRETSVGNPDWSFERHDAALAQVLRAIRRDVHPAAPDDGSIEFHLIDIPPLVVWRTRHHLDERERQEQAVADP